MSYNLLLKTKWYVFAFILLIFLSKTLFAKNIYVNNLEYYTMPFNYENLAQASNTSNDFSEFDDLDSNEESQIYNIKDPLEKLNRKSFAFTMWIDKTIISHVEDAYVFVLPKPVRAGLFNMAKNFNEPVSAVNHLLQFKFISFAEVTLRFAINSTLGFFGAIDVASTLNLPPNYNDLGYTLSYYHVGNGFYIFVPVLGPYTLETALSDLASSLVYSEVIDNTINFSYFWVFVAQSSGRIISYLENRDTLISLLHSSTDSYSLVKSAFIQNRAFNINRLKNSW